MQEDDGFQVDILQQMATNAKLLITQWDIQDEEENNYKKSAIERLNNTRPLIAEYSKDIDTETRKGSLDKFLKVKKNVDEAVQLFLSKIS